MTALSLPLSMICMDKSHYDRIPLWLLISSGKSMILRQAPIMPFNSALSSNRSLSNGVLDTT